MVQDRHIWRVWASFLQRWGVSEWVAVTLEIAGPLSVLGAQALLLAQPLLSRVVSDESLDALVRLFDEPTQTREFVSYLREATSQ